MVKENAKKMVDGRMLVALAPLALALKERRGDPGVRLITKGANYKVFQFDRSWIHRENDAGNGCCGGGYEIAESDVIAVEVHHDNQRRTMRLAELMALATA